MPKSPDAFRTISEVSAWLDTPAHVLRFWESKFREVAPVKRAGGRRYYRPEDMALLGGIKKLLHEDGMTIKGAQKLLREQGVAHVSAMAQPFGAAPEPTNVVNLRPTAETPAASAPAAAPKTAPKTAPRPKPEKVTSPEMQFSLFPDQNIIPGDPEDTDSFAPARLLASLGRAKPKALAKRAKAIDGLVDRLVQIHPQKTQ